MPFLLGDVRERAGERPGLSPQPTCKPRAETLATRGRFVWLYLSKAVAPAAFLLVSPLLPVTFPHVPATGVFSMSHHPRPFLPENPVGFCRPDFYCRCPRADPHRDLGPVKKRGGDFVEREKGTSMNHGFHKNHFFLLGG